MLYTDLIDLARLCVKRARLASNSAVADRLMQLAKEYQGRAAELAGGELPDIGEALSLAPDGVQQQQQPQDLEKGKGPKKDGG
jgi:hypothetical protein